MSTENSVEQQMVDETRELIRRLVGEISVLARQELSVREFYGEFLNRVVAALSALGGAVWSGGEGNAIELQYQINLRETQLTEGQENLVRHGRLIQKVLATGQPQLALPQSGDGEAGNPSDLLLVLAPVRVNQETKSVIEIFQRPTAKTATQRGYLRFLVQMCDLAADYLKSHQLKHFTDRQALWDQLEGFTREVHASLESEATGFTIVNEGRRLIGCDRVTLALKRGRKCYVTAISGQDTLDKRSTTVQLLSSMATAVAATGEEVWYVGDTSRLAPQVESALEAYVDESHSKCVAILPLREPPPEPVDNDPETDPERALGPVLGALIVEQIEDSRPRDGMQHRVAVVCEHSSRALTNCLEHENLFLMPLWRAIGKSRWVVGTRTLPKTITIASLVVAALVSLFIIPWDFDLEGKGFLQPSERRDVFALQDGIVDQLLIEHGAAVKTGDLLAVLRNNELRQETERLVGEHASVQQQLLSTTFALRKESSLSREERIRLEGQQLEYRSRVESLAAQIKLNQEKIEQLSVYSPIDGLINTWDVQELLLNRPVKQGQSLLSVADPAGPWEVELHMPEDRLGHIRRAQEEFKPENLSVAFFLATAPDQRYVGWVEEINLRARVEGEEGNIVLIRVAFKPGTIPQGALSHGASVTARVNCGRSSLGYWLFHDALAFLESRVFFWLW